MSQARKRSRVQFSVRDTAKRKKEVLSKIAAIIHTTYTPIKYHNINPLELKQSSLIVDSEWFITNYLKAFVQPEGTSNGKYKHNNYVSYTPVKLINHLNEVLFSIFDENIDLDIITNEQIIIAERFFESRQHSE